MTITEQIQHEVMLAAWETWGTAARWDPQHGWYDPLEAERLEPRRWTP